MKNQLLHKLIDLLEDFSQKHDSGTMEDFVVWLIGEYFQSNEANSHQDQLDLMLAFQIAMLNKTIKRQTKDIISDSPLSSLDGYSFLLHLEQAGSLRKMELVEMHNLEAPTGIEIIKRLLTKGLIEEFNDSEDRRAKRVKMTKDGHKELDRLKPLIEERFANFAGALTLNEKLSLVATTNKLIGS